MKTKLLFALLALSTIVSAQNIYTYAGTGTQGFSGDGGAAANAKINTASGVATDALGNVYITDMGNNRVRKVNTAGVISTIAGTGVYASNGDGGAATLAQLMSPSGVAVDGLGNIYIVDMDDSKVRKINTAGIISTFAGTGVAGFSGDGGAATSAQLKPFGVATDASGNVYIADFGNHRVRKVNASGTISTIAGTGVSGFSGDGGAATLAQLDMPAGLTIDALGNIYIADENGLVRKINPSGIISTFAGGGSGGLGDGGAANLAQMVGPSGVALDASGNIYISDLGHRIRKVNTAGIITTIAGTGIGGFSGDGGSANLAQIYGPEAIAIDPSGNIFIADMFNNRIREICVGSCLLNINSFQENKNSISVFPNPTNDKINLVLDKETSTSTLKLTNSLGQIIFEKENVAEEKFTIDISEQANGIYFLEVKQGETISRIKVIKN